MKNDNQSLIDYVAKLIQSNQTKSQIKDQLIAVGWSENQADAVYSQALIKIGIPVPSKAMQSTFGKKSSALEITINLFSFILLGTIATSLGVLFYQVINHFFPDNLSYRSRVISSSAIHYSIAVLLIASPIFYYSLSLWFRSFQKDQAKIETALTKWLTYLVLLVASITIVGDLIITVYTFLQGEISVRFFLKALVILLIAGIIFSFYFLERNKIQHREAINSKVFKIFGIDVAILIIVAIVLGFIVGGSPSTERKRGLDDRREQDLYSLSSCIETYARTYKRLPNSLEELQNSSSTSYCANKTDPETGDEYDYKIVVASKTVGTNKEAVYELCADFALASEENINTADKSSYSYNYQNENKWNQHTAGYECDQSTVVLEEINQNPTGVIPIQYQLDQ